MPSPSPALRKRDKKYEALLVWPERPWGPKAWLERAEGQVTDKQAAGKPSRATLKISVECEEFGHWLYYDGKARIQECR
jgi:hypothetical protein|nr:MAG: hypothetical protein TU35_05680 [Thermoproteus sp. AZ2]